MELNNNKFAKLMFEAVEKNIEQMDKKLEFYKKYVGCPITVVVIQDSHGNILYPENDPFYKQIMEQAQIDNFKIRLWFPMTVGTRDFRPDRLNISLKKTQEHLYQITKVELG